MALVSCLNSRRRKTAIFCADLVYLCVCAIFRLMGLSTGYCDKGIKKGFIVSVCTNGMGHIHQCIRVLTVLKEKTGLKASAIVVGRRSKLPPHTNVFFNQYGAEVIDLDGEIDYDDGLSVSNVRTLCSFVKFLLFFGLRTSRKVCLLLQKHRPRVLLNFWEPFLPTFITANRSRIDIVSIASQILLAEDFRLNTCDLFFIRMVLNANGAQGVCIPFSQFPLDQAIPQIVSLPSQRVLKPQSRHFNGKPFFVAYGCMPLTLVADILKLYEHKVLLFVKDTSSWEQFYSSFPHVTVSPRSQRFVEMLGQRNCCGLICQPSRGVVTQALALAKPIYLILPDGHLEQQANLRQYHENYDGVSSAATLPIKDWAISAINLQMMLSQSLKKHSVEVQARNLRSWLSKTDRRIVEKIAPLISE